MQDPNQPPNNYGRPENPGQLPNDPTGGYNVPQQPGYPPPSYPPQPDYGQGGYQQPPSQGPQPPPRYNQPPAEGYPQPPPYGQPPTQAYPPPQPPYIQPPAQGYPQPPYQQPAYGQPPPPYPQPPRYGQPGYPPAYQTGGPFTPPPIPATMVKRSGGAGPIIAVVIVVLLIAAGVGGYFLFFNKSGGSNNGGNVSSGGATQPTATAASTKNGGGATNPIPTTNNGGSGNTGGGGGSSENANLLKTAANNMKSLKSYHLDLSGTAAGQSIAMNGDIDIAGKKSNINLSAAGMNISVVTVGNDAYISTDGGKTFTKTDPSSNPVSGLGSFTKMWDGFKPADIDKAASALKDASPANDTIDGANTKHITANAQDLSSLSSAAGSGGVMTGTVDIWVSTDANPTVRQMKVNGASSGQGIDFTMKWSKINENFDINAPGLSGSNNNGNTNVLLGVEKTYPISNGVNNHKDGTINYAAIAPYVIPPVGGPHNPIWYNCGIYNQPIPTENAVHDLEHGVVWVTYQPSLDANVLSTLQGIARNYQKILLSPYPGIPAPIIASAWGGGGNTGYQIRINPGDWNTLQSFITKHSGAADAPEPGAGCTGGQGTPLP